MIYTITLNPAVDRELTVPEIEFDSVLRADQWRVDYGGKGFNVSRLLKSLGTPSVALGFAGGRSGELLRDGLNSLGIETDFIWVQGETRTNVSIVSNAQGRYVKANEPGPTISAYEIAALLEKTRTLAKPDDWWVLAGSLPPGVPTSIYADIIENVQSRQSRVILDTSGEALNHGCRSAPYLVKPNAYEAHKLTGLSIDSPAKIAAAAQAIQKMGASVVVISMGKDGAMLVEDDQVWVAKSPKIQERNPIGAGDSMVGGLVWGLNAGLELRGALKWGVASGAAAASLSGTGVGSRELVEALHAQVSVEPVEYPLTVP